MENHYTWIQCAYPTYNKYKYQGYLYAYYYVIFFTTFITFTKS